MKICKLSQSIIFSFLFSSSLFSQEMKLDDNNNILVEGEIITLAKATELSYKVSNKAFNQFAIHQLRLFDYLIPTTVGSALIVNGIVKSQSIYPPGSYEQIAIGTILTAGGALENMRYRKRQGRIKKAVDIYNTELPSYKERILAKEKRDLEKELAEQKRIKERERIEIAKIAEEKNKLERFYAQLTERLSQPLEVIEGVYKSIDQGESYEYDIAILKSLKETDEYIAIVLGSTDPSLNIGMGLFTFKTTAQSNLFFVEYQTKAGKQYTNKTAILDGALLTMGLKSFVKMYPSDGEERNYTEINPLFDWESSGSGVLINQDGYIVTNNHVATGADRIRIAFQNDSTDYNAIIISQNEATDVAILKIEDDRFESNIEPVNWETDFNLGQKVFTLGYPISNKMSNNVKVVDGIVSGVNGVGGSPIYFQTTLPVWYGNSGGPCFNSKGEILGLATQILWDQGAKVDNVAYITKTENILNLAGDIINHNSKARQDKDLEQLSEELIPYSVFIKVND